MKNHSMNTSNISNSVAILIAIAGVGYLLSIAVIGARYWLLLSFALIVLLTIIALYFRINFLLMLVACLIVISFAFSYPVQRNFYIVSAFGIHVIFNHVLFVAILCSFFILLAMNRSYSVTLTKLHKSVLLFLLYIVSVPTFYTLIFHIEDTKWLIRELVPILFLVLIIPFTSAVKAERDVNLTVNSIFWGIIIFFILYVLYNTGFITVPWYETFFYGKSRLLIDGSVHRVRGVAEILVMTAIFLSLSLYLFYKEKATYLVMAALGVIYIVVSQTRTAISATAVGFVLLSILYLRYEKKNRRKKFRRIKVLIFFIVVLLIIIALFHDYVDIYFERILSIGTVFDASGDVSFLARTTEWKSMLSQLFLENPVIGGGIGRTYTMDMWGRHLPNFVGSSNISVWLLSKTGLIGFLLFLNIFLAFFKMLNRTIKKTKSNYGRGVLIGIFVSSITILIVASIFSDYLTSDVFCILFALFFAIVTCFDNINIDYKKSASGTYQ